MYSVEYCDDSAAGKLFDSSLNYPDSISDEIISRLESLNRFMYLIDMFRVIKSCTDDMQDIPCGEDVEFWTINKYLLSYLNAVYSYREFVCSYIPSLKAIHNEFYFGKKWYRFVCDYRNRVIHQSTLIKDRSFRTGDIYIDIIDMVSIQEKIISELEKKKGDDVKKNEVIEYQIKNAKRFLQEIKSLSSAPILITKDGKKYLSMKYIATEADREISMMNDRFLLHAYQEAVFPALQFLLSLVYRVDGFYKYTFIVNKSIIGDPRKVDVSCFEPTHSIESFFIYILRSLGKENMISNEIFNWLTGERYHYSYEKRCELEKLIE